jgi:hypothetical protein
VFHFVFDALVEPNGLLINPFEPDMLGLPNTLGEVLVEVVELLENMPVEGTPKMFDVLKPEDSAGIPSVLVVKGLDLVTDGAPKTLGDGFSEDLGIVVPKVNPKGVPNTLGIG